MNKVEEDTKKRGSRQSDKGRKEENKKVQSKLWLK